jgi:choline dehydrogenase-like flavoprotein
MANLNIDSVKARTFDAIVIGSGMSGGWAAKEFTDKGLKTLVVERGRQVEHNKDYPTTNLNPWEFAHNGKVPLAVQEANPIASRCYVFKEDAMHFVVKDQEHPYVQEKPFDWIRGYQVGGKSLLWARQTQRWSQYDFEGPARDGFAVDWPIRYADLAPWYSHVEKFAGISGNRDGLAELPDGEFMPGFPLNAVEEHFRQQVRQKYPGRHVISARCAHLSQPQPIHYAQGRVQCQNRTLCQRGCPFGGYFSSNSSTLPWAMKSGHLILKPDLVVQTILYDEQRGRATGIRVVDAHTKATVEYYAPVIFVSAGALNTNLLLLNSTSHRFPNGLGNDSGVLGQYVAFHNYSARVFAEYDGLSDLTTDGRNPAGGGYLPRFRNVLKQETDFLRGYATSFGASRDLVQPAHGLGASLKQQLERPALGPWRVHAGMMGETIPKATNYVRLDPARKDAWDMPLLSVSVDYDDNDAKMKQDFFEQLPGMTQDSRQAPGLDIHEMGGVRMGHDAKTSMLNRWNQLHTCPNVYVTDSACMTSTSTQNPSLTYMALTARAVDHAVSELKKQNL